MNNKKALLTSIVFLLCVAGLMLACGAKDSPSDTVAGKGDWVGNKTSGACSYDWQCKADEGMVCRPEGLPTEEWIGICGPPNELYKPCLEDNDCVSGHCPYVADSGLRGYCYPGMVHASP